MSSSKTPVESHLPVQPVYLSDTPERSVQSLSIIDKPKTKERNKQKLFTNVSLDTYRIGDKHLKEILTEELDEETTTSKFSWFTAIAMVLTSTGTVITKLSETVQAETDKIKTLLLPISVIVLALYVSDQAREYLKGRNKKRKTKEERIQRIMQRARGEEIYDNP